MLTTESALVQIWARNIKTEKYPNRLYYHTQIPQLSNLKEMVLTLLNEQGAVLVDKEIV